MMAKFNSIHLLLFLAFVFSITKLSQSQGTLEISLNKYTELANDKSDKCIKLCVTTSPSGFPRCNLNTSDDTAYVIIKAIGKKVFGSPHPVKHIFKFNEWEDNSELSVTVWKLQAGQLLSDCATINPTNSTSHGEAGIIIPREEKFHSHILVTDKWKLKINTILKCNVQECLPRCADRDDGAGHYTCHLGNKNCLRNWFGKNCTTFCNVTSLTYNCDKNGKKTCFKNWFGGSCLRFCDNSSTTYTCNNTGFKQCIINYYGENCLTFCNSSASTYNCSKNGEKNCLKNWFGKDCSKFCDTSAENYLCSVNGSIICNENCFGKHCETFCNESAINYHCNKDGKKTCLPNWFGNLSCSIFCDTSSKNYHCGKNGSKICAPNQFGEDCVVFCNASAVNFKCEKDGRKTCLPNWFNRNCEQFCDSDAGNYLCDDEGHRVCFQHWYGEECATYCNNSAANYKCNNRGDKICLRDWYGRNCTKFCNNSDERFKCDANGNKTCMRNWFGRDCSRQCESVPSRYQCDVNGTKTCVEDMYGHECEIRCKVISTSGLFYCWREDEDAGEGGCPEDWKDTNCLGECENENENIKTHKEKCEASEKKASICSNDTTTDSDDNCSFVEPAEYGAQKGSSNDVSNVKLYGGLFGALFLMLIITTVVVVYVSVKKKQTTTTSPFYENPRETTQDVFARKFNRAELTLNIDQLMLRRQSDTEGLGYDNPGMMVENPLYDSKRPNLRAAIPYNKPLPDRPVSSSSKVFFMSNTEV